MWTYSQSTGKVALDGKRMGSGYSGLPPYTNNPEAESMNRIGPIPRGEWIIGKPVTHPKLGPIALPLSPAPDTITFNRDAFWIHDDSTAPGHGSNGGIILAPQLRRKIADSGDTRLIVSD